MRVDLRVVALALVATLGAGCDEKLAELTGPTPNLQPTFSSIQRDIFQAADSSGRPACVSCHNSPRGFFARLNLLGDGAYAQLVNVPSVQKPGLLRVQPGNPDASYLIHKLEGGPAIQGDRMPQGASPLTPGQIQVIRRWIARGAPND